VNLTALKKAEPKKAKAEKPTLPDPTGEFSQLVTSAIEAKASVDAHTVVLDQAKSTLGSAAIGHLFRMAQGKAEPEDTFQVLGPRGKAIVSVKNAYKIPEDIEPVRALLGPHADTYLRAQVEIVIDASAIPAACQQFFIDELIKIARVCDQVMLGAEGDGPVFNAIAVKQVTKVDKAFHADRHRLFSPEENTVIHHALPCVVSTRLDY
jgi:hypothetical protein